MKVSAGALLLPPSGGGREGGTCSRDASRIALQKIQRSRPIPLHIPEFTPDAAKTRDADCATVAACPPTWPPKRKGGSAARRPALFDIVNAASKSRSA